MAHELTMKSTHKDIFVHVNSIKHFSHNLLSGGISSYTM